MELVSGRNEDTVVTESLPSLTEYAVLGILAEGPAHGFAIARNLEPGSALGRILTIRRPLVYRALDELIAAALVKPKHIEPGNSGPQRVIHRITPKGRRVLQSWLDEPVEHIRDIRIRFQLKLAFCDRFGRSPLPLIAAQKAVLEPTLSALEHLEEAPPDHVELWRHYNAQAAEAYLDRLQRIHGEPIA